MPKLLKLERGATLLEICVCLSIIIILNSFALPQLRDFKIYYDSLATQKSLLSLIGSSRAIALYQDQIVTICPISEAKSCSSEWNQPISVFVDENSNATLDLDEEVLTIWDERQDYVDLNWTLDRRYIRFRPNGSTTATTGSLRYCLRDNNNSNNFRIVISRTGRTRVDRKSHGC